MSRGLPELLDELVPEPPRRLDPELVLSAARRRQGRRRAAVTAAAAVVVAAAVAPFLLLQGSRGGGELAVADVPLTVSALERRVPLGEVALGALGDAAPLAHPGEGTLVGVGGDDEVWLVPTSDDRLCLLSVYEKHGSAGSDCRPRAELLRRGLVLATRGVRPGAPQLVAVAVPDGYSTAAAGGVEAEVRRNVALLAFDRMPRGELRISGPGRPTVVFPLDDLSPPGPRSPSGRDAGAGEEARVRLQLAELVRLADRFRQDEPTLDGFTASLSADRRAEAEALLDELTDEVARARVGSQCLAADLRTATLQQRPC